MFSQGFHRGFLVFPGSGDVFSHGIVLLHFPQQSLACSLGFVMGLGYVLFLCCFAVALNQFTVVLYLSCNRFITVLQGYCWCLLVVLGLSSVSGDVHCSFCFFVYDFFKSCLRRFTLSVSTFAKHLLACLEEKQVENLVISLEYHRTPQKTC